MHGIQQLMTVVRAAILKENSEKLEPAHEIMVHMIWATTEGSGEPAHPRSLARAFAVRKNKVRESTKCPTKNQTVSPTGWLRAFEE